MPRRAADLAFWVVVGICSVLAVVALLLLSGHLASDGSDPPAARTPVVPPSTGARRAKRPPPPPPAAVPAASTTTQAAVLQVTIQASRGDCWVEAHKGGEQGPVLLERVVNQGETVTLRGQRIWLALGAAGNVDISVDGKTRTIPNGTTQITLG
jgi:hypothetical protein